MNSDGRGNEKHTFKQTTKLRRFLISKEEEFEKLLEGAEKLVKIREETGEPVVLIGANEGSLADRIFLHFAGAEISSRLGLRKDASVGLNELCDSFKLESKLGGARVSDLHSEHLVRRTERGVYELDVTRSLDRLKKLKKKYGVEK